MTALNPAFLAFLESQGAEYRRLLPERLAQIESLWRMVLDGTVPAQSLASLERCAHGLAGSGATFGCRELGDAARVLELAVHPLLDRATVLTPAERVEIGHAVAALRGQLPVDAAGHGV